MGNGRLRAVRPFLEDLKFDLFRDGDGVIDLKSIPAMVEATGYDFLIDVEIFSAQNWWKRASWSPPGG